MRLRHVRRLWFVCAGVGLGCRWPGAHRSDAAVYGGAPPDSIANRHTCGRWLWQPPRNDRLLVDIDPAINDTTANGAALAARIRAAGGQVVHVFAVARVRAEIDLDRALALTGEVTIVHDPRRVDVPVVVSLEAPFSTSDSLRLARAGARVDIARDAASSAASVLSNRHRAGQRCTGAPARHASTGEPTWAGLHCRIVKPGHA
jgi:hypothetical protein